MTTATTVFQQNLNLGLVCDLRTVLYLNEEPQKDNNIHCSDKKLIWIGIAYRTKHSCKLSVGELKVYRLKEVDAR